MHLPALFSRKTSLQQYRSGKNLAEHTRTVSKLWQKMRFPALLSRKTGLQQYRSGKNLAEYNRTVTKLWQKMHFLAPFGRFYGVFCPNGQQIEAKCIYPHCSVEKLARQQYRSGKNLAEHNRTLSKLRQRMHFPAPFGHLYGVFRPNG